MDLKQLAAVVTVADAGSVTKAARLLHLVQPAVTRQIRTLEDELGVTLFERTRHGMVLTAAGDKLVARARRAINEVERARAELRPDPGGVTGTVTVGILESVVDIVLEPLAAAVADRYPGIGLRVLCGYSGHLQQWLDDGDIDVSLLYGLASTQSLAVTPILRERLWAVAPPHAELDASHPVSWEEMLRHPLVLPIAGHGLRELIDQADVPPMHQSAVVAETNSMVVQKQLVQAGRGWTVLPAAGVAADVAAGRLSGAPLGAPEIVRTVVLGLQRGSWMPPPVQAVAVQLTGVVRAAVVAGRWPSATLLTDSESASR